LGIFLLFVSLLADGFLPDFQAEIKAEFKPMPTEMMEHINKWVAIISLASMIASLTALSAFTYAFYHPMFMVHLIALALLSAAGQFVVYTMIKLFKQHIVPFVITTRKILTIFISIVFYHHKTNALQLSGMGLVFGAVVAEFLSEVTKDEKHGQSVHDKGVHLAPAELKEEDGRDETSSVEAHIEIQDQN
jgi:drug/metabolite transporter (DMT)-like permease